MTESSPFSGDGGSESGGATVSFLKPGRQTSDLLEQHAQFWTEMAKLRGRSLRLGFPEIDRRLKPSAYRYTVIAARPGMFKTTLAWAWAVNLAMQGKKVLWLGVEMRPQEQVAWGLSRLARIPLETILSVSMGDSSATSSQEQFLRSAAATLTSLPMVVWPHTGIALDELTDTVTAAPYDAVFLDYVQLVKTAHRKEYEQISAVSQAIQKLTRSLPIFFVALAQMNREIERADQSKGPPRLPQLSDLKGSGQIEQDADAVCFLHRLNPNDKTQVDFRIVKNRYGEPDTFVPLRANPDFREIDEWCPNCNQTGKCLCTRTTHVSGGGAAAAPVPASAPSAPEPPDPPWQDGPGPDAPFEDDLPL